MEKAVLAEFEMQLDRQLDMVADQLSAITIGHLTSAMLQQRDVEGSKVAAVCGALYNNVKAHYERQAIVLHRSGQAEELEHQLGVAEEEAAMAEGARTPLGEEAAHGTADNGMQLADVVELKMRAAYERKQAKKADQFNARQTPRSLKGILESSNVDLRITLESAQKMQLAAYLMDRLVQHARFRPTGDEMARARQLYWAMLDKPVESTESGLVDDPRWSLLALDEMDDQHTWDAPEPVSPLSLLSDSDGSYEEADETEGDVLADDCSNWRGNSPSSGHGAASHDGSLFQTSVTSDAAGDVSDAADDLSDAADDLSDAADDLSDSTSGEGFEHCGDTSTEGQEHDDGWVSAFQVYNAYGSSLKEQLSYASSPYATGKGKQLRSQTYIRAHPLLYDTLVSGDMSSLRHGIRPEAKPMLIPPIAWTKQPGELPSGGQLIRSTDFVRTSSVQHKRLIREQSAESLQPMLDGLNALSRTAWRVNRRVLSLVQLMWEAYPTGLPFVSDCPSAVPFPPMPSAPAAPPEGASESEVSEHQRMARAASKQYQTDLREARLKQFNFHSQRVSARLKLDVASEFANEERFYFTHNIDFRGRVYAVGPHLQYLGDDLARGLLQFAAPRPLGADGLFWLKVQLANLYGKDKLPLEERAEWTDAQIADGRIHEADATPLASRSREWWSASDNPLQTLALCFELQAIADAVARGEDEREFGSVIPVHMDGSCNGLQHYAALGRDPVGAPQVNLTPGDRPSDVYEGVRRLVAIKVAADAATPLQSELPEGGEDPHRTPTDADILAARALDGLISRKVVKQSVMTTVYGVTSRGARDQIYNRLNDVLDAGAFAQPQSRDDLRRLATYTARLTLSSLDENFSGATEAMRWLALVATRVAKDTSRPVQWATPLGWTVLQPYFKIGRRRVNTAFCSMTILNQDQLDMLDDNSKAPPNLMKQRSALPPNYVHSLDSTHMLMTVTRCVLEEGLEFAAVHDSYWTHACDVPVMNRVLREAFIDLHTSTDLSRFYDELQREYPDIAWDELPPPPPQGDLDISQVRDSTYFFS